MNFFLNLTARKNGPKPLSIREYDPRNPADFVSRIPRLGTTIPEGWVHAERIEHLIYHPVDLPQLAARLYNFKLSGDNYGFGIYAESDGRKVIRVYRPDPRDITHSGNLTEAELRQIREK